MYFYNFLPRADFNRSLCFPTKLESHLSKSLSTQSRSFSALALPRIIYAILSHTSRLPETLGTCQFRWRIFRRELHSEILRIPDAWKAFPCGFPFRAFPRFSMFKNLIIAALGFVSLHFYDSFSRGAFSCNK